MYADAHGFPSLAWVARVRRAGAIEVFAGTSIRRTATGFFEGTWAGPAELDTLPELTTVFGSGVIARGEGLAVVTPSHNLESVYHVVVDGVLHVSNSFAGLLTAARLELDPDADYPSIFTRAAKLRWLLEDDVSHVTNSAVSIPTRTTAITAQSFENLAIRADLSLSVERKRREQPMASFDDFRRRLTAALSSAIGNAAPYEPVVALSSGYDSTAVAAVAAGLGCRRSIGFRSSRTSRHDGRDDDSGAATAARLGLRHETFDRLAYMSAETCPEADFLATGMAGEEVVFHAFEGALRRAVLLTGYWGGTQWAMADSDAWRRMQPADTGGASLTEFRLRTDFYHVPVPFFAAAQGRDAPHLLDLPEMAPYRVGGHYDRPIPRRLAEEAGIPRGTFAVGKRAANVLPQHEGPGAFSVAARASLERFAAAEGRPVRFHRRRRTTRWERGLIAAARRMGIERLAGPVVRRRERLVHFEPRFGTLVLRWAVSVVSGRYAATIGQGS